MSSYGDNTTVSPYDDRSGDIDLLRGAVAARRHVTLYAGAGLELRCRRSGGMMPLTWEFAVALEIYGTPMARGNGR